MDLSAFSPADWAAFAAIPNPPEAVLAALVSAMATLALLVAFRHRLVPAQGRAPAPADPEALGHCDFLVNGASLRPVNERARALLAGIGAGGPRLTALSNYLALDCPGIRADIEALVLYGTGFRHHCPRGDGSTVEILGEPRGDGAFLSIRPASEDARALQDARAALDRSAAEAAFLRSVIDVAPVMAWSQSPDGHVDWANAAYRDRFDAASGGPADHRIADAFGHVLEEVPLTAKGAGVRRRVSIADDEGSETRWFEVCQRPGPDDATLGFALEADEIVAAEASLRRFVETLTETFAHLPIGLAVFDKNRRLGLFNPALSQLVKIDAVWLAGRPSLRDFLERLRETRQMPEQKDFAAWRRKLTELEEGARDGTYEENWVLPSGKILRVTGRPHPQGAVAFLFEDISTAIQLERKYRSELELSQATLDRLSEAVAVFDASGALVFVNSAFEELWGLDPMAQLEGPGVATLTRLWANRCAPNPAWARLTDFATGDATRASWKTRVETRDGRSLQMLVAPLPDASALVLFRDLTAEAADEARAAADRVARAQDAALDGLALDQLRIPVEAAVRSVAAAIPAAQSPQSFKELTAAAERLKDGLARSGEIRAAASGEAGPEADGPLPALAAVLTARGLTLEVDPAAAAWPDEIRRASFALGLAAAELAAPAAAVSVRLETTDSRRRLVARVAAGREADATDRIGTALARRVVEAAGGRIAVAHDAGAVTFAAEMPVALPELAGGAPDAPEPRPSLRA